MAENEKAKHTPGPWYVPKGQPFMVDAPLPDKAEGDNDFRIAKTYASPFSPNQVQAKANAQLIAAAPDLLAALQDITPADDPAAEDCDCITVLIPVSQIRAALAALAKAKGG